jgi:two-component system cell cycle response regulator
VEAFSHNPPQRSRVLVLTATAADARRIAGILHRRCLQSVKTPRRTRSSMRGPILCQCVGHSGGGGGTGSGGGGGRTGADAATPACCAWVDSISGLHRTDLDQFDVLVSDAALREGDSLDVLAYMQGAASHKAVIVLGDDPSLAMEAIRAGARDFILRRSQADLKSLPLAIEKTLLQHRIVQENQRLHADLQRSIDELAITNRQLQEVIRQLETMARTDELTGLCNRRWFNLMLNGSWAESIRNGLPLACLLIDLDGFKAVNDTLGHHAGDDLLRLTARVIRANCRDVDVPARVGGDEFCVLMSHTQARDAAMVAQRIMREFEHAVQNMTSGSLATRAVSMSMGLGHIDLSRPANAEQLVSHADQAMYAAKLAGKHRILIRMSDGMRPVSEMLAVSQ